MTSLSSSLSRLIPLEDGPGKLSGGGDGTGDRGKIHWALRISTT